MPIFVRVLSRRRGISRILCIFCGVEGGRVDEAGVCLSFVTVGFEIAHDRQTQHTHTHRKMTIVLTSHAEVPEQIFKSI